MNYQKADNVIERMIDGKLLLVKMGDSQGPYAFAGIGCDVWQAIRSGMPIASIIAVIAELYGMSPSIVEEDVYRFVSDLSTQGLLTPVEACHAAQTIP